MSDPGPSTAKPARLNARQRALIEFILDNLVWIMLAVVLTVFSLTIPQYFQVGIFANIVEQSTFVGVMAIGLAIVIIAGNMDLSVELVAGLTAMVTGMLFCARGIGLGYSFSPAWLVLPISLAIALFVGGIIGAVNGWLVVRLKMNAFIVTLAAYIWVRGLVVTISGGRSAQDLAPSLRIIGIETFLHVPLIAWIAIACFALSTFVMTKTPFGRHLMMIGGNAVASFRAGIRGRPACARYVRSGRCRVGSGRLAARHPDFGRHRQPGDRNAVPGIRGGSNRGREPQRAASDSFPGSTPACCCFHPSTRPSISWDCRLTLPR